MNQKEWQLYNSHEDVQFVSATELTNRENRTLLFGYAGEHDYHLYLQDKLLVVHIYLNHGDPEFFTTVSKTPDLQWLIGELLPSNLSIDPACSDFEFCTLLRSKGVELEFELFEEVDALQYYGEI